MELSIEQIEALLHAAYEKGRAAVVKSWNEADHPRDKIGEFASAGESSATPSREELLDLFGGFSHEGQKEFDWDHATYAPDSNSADDTVPGFTRDFDEYLTNKDDYAELATHLAPDVKKFTDDYDKLRSKLVAAGDGYKAALSDLIKTAAKYHSLKDDYGSAKLADLEIADYGYPPSKPRNPDDLTDYEKELTDYKAARSTAIADAKAKRKSELDAIAKDMEPARERFRASNKAALLAFRKINKVNEKIDELIEPLHDVDGEQKSFRPAVIKGGWDEKLHPRGDDGRFINKDEISAASKSPAKAAELRQRVTDPTERGKLNAAIGDAGNADKKLAGQYSKTPTGFAAGLDLPKKRPGTREPLPTATTGRGHSDRPDVMDTVNMARQLRRGALDQSARGELAKRLDGHTADELRQIKSELGIRATGRKAELAGKILMAAAGHDYPEQGFTGALPVKGQGVHHYEDGVLTRVEKYPSEIYSSRVTPDEAHALIEGYQSKGLLTSKEARTYIAHMLMHRMSYRDISELKRKLGLKASGRKAVYAQRIQALVEDRERRERQNPDHPANKPDPMGTMGSLAERQADIEAKRATYGGANLQHPDRKAAVDEAADRLRLAVKSPFAAFNRDAALGEVKNALNDLYNTGEVLSAAHLAGIKLDPKDGTPVQQMAAAVFRLAGGDDSPLPSKPTNLLDGLGSEQNPASVPSNHTHAITGDTYPHREAIKRAGGTWDKVAKQWTIDEEGTQYLPDGLTAEPMAHRMPRADVAVKPADSKTLFDDVKDKGTPPAPRPTVPDHIRKQAEDLKQWHQKASRHEVEYQKMLPWNADMMRKGDEAQRADVAKRMGELIRKHPELADEYGPYVKKGPNLPSPPTPEEHLAKHGADANPHQVVDDYMAAGGHPNDLRRHLNPETAKESYSNRTGLISARSKAIREVGEHLAGKAAAQPAAVEPAPAAAPAEPAGDSPVSKQPHEMSREEYHASQQEEHPMGGKLSPRELDMKRGHDIEKAAMAGKKVPDNVLAEYPKLHAKYAGKNTAMTSEPAAEQPAASASPAVPDPTPGRTEHLQAVASGAGHDELRDAADTVSRIEDIPVGERTADDRAELKRAKELAAAGGAGSPSSTGAKNPVPNPEFAGPSQPTGDLFNDYVPAAKRVASPEEAAAKQQQATVAIEEAVGMKTVATREKEEAAAPTPDDHEKTIRDIKPGESAEINGHKVRRGKLNEESVSIDLPEGGVRTDTVNGAAKFLSKRFPYSKGSPASRDPDAPDTKTSHGKASAIPIGVTDKADFKRKSIAVESPAYLLPL